MDTLRDRLVQSWTDNAHAWTRAVRSGAVASREAGTDAAVVEAVLRGLPPAGRVLDVGCGEGWLVRALAAVGVEARGVDASAPLVDAAREAAREAEASGPSGGAFEVVSYDQAAADPDRLGGPFDAVVFNFSLLSDDTVGVLRAAASRLDGGRVLVQTVHPATAAAPYRDGWREESFESVGAGFAPMPWYFRTFGSWVRTLDAAGLALADAAEPLHPETGAPLSLILEASPRPSAGGLL